MSEMQQEQPEIIAEQQTNNNSSLAITTPYDSDAHFQFVRARLLTHILTEDRLFWYARDSCVAT